MISVVRSSKWCLIALMASIAICAVIFVLDTRQDDDPDWREKSLRFSFLVENKTTEFLPKTMFKFLVPLEIEGRQGLIGLDSDQSLEIEVQEGNARYARVLLREFKPYEKRVVKVDIKVRLAKSPPHSAVPSDEYLSNESYIEASHPLVRSVVAKEDFVGPQEIYSWVSQRIQKDAYTLLPKGAVWALSRLHGDCTEHMFSFMALARNRGIPARGAAGLVSRNRVHRVSGSDFHNWAEYYGGDRWRIADTFSEVFDEHYESYVLLNFYKGEIAPFVQADDGLAVRL
ncbi:transglutaminase-like domain-containing protein [Gilvimarinus algae]|uniref:Transglutaminase domain-containing protein n=1 Tax=Gilvimarinus algae TaxID=3058037 RepID=A0ABT8TNL4_9GAMM|nr:transglutaminase domain-containing protein [Gilvimarinus sp. SDUM040014]MDO3383997.1 transglutaminase domain-containing protein [Gilvimarinus sp. SDUM040014]